MSDDRRRTRVGRDDDGNIVSASICDCIPRPSEDSRLHLTKLELTCEAGLALVSSNNGSLAAQSYEVPCSDGACLRRKEDGGWPTCQPVLDQPWSDWSHNNCHDIVVEGTVFSCGNGTKTRVRNVRESASEEWREEEEVVLCRECGNVAKSLLHLSDWPFNSGDDTAGRIRKTLVHLQILE